MELMIYKYLTTALLLKKIVLQSLFQIMTIKTVMGLVFTFITKELLPHLIIGPLGTIRLIIPRLITMEL